MPKIRCWCSLIDGVTKSLLCLKICREIPRTQFKPGLHIPSSSCAAPVISHLRNQVFSSLFFWLLDLRPLSVEPHSSHSIHPSNHPPIQPSQSSTHPSTPTFHTHIHTPTLLHSHLSTYPPIYTSILSLRLSSSTPT